MKSMGNVLFFAAVAFGCAGVSAQPGSGGGNGPGARWGADYTHGWTLLTPAERKEHQDRMRSMKSYDECTTYMEKHREQMAARAAERGRKALAQPRRDACATLKP